MPSRIKAQVPPGRLELSRPEPTRYHKVSNDAAAIETLFVDLFVEAHRRAPAQIILDLDATDDPLHGHRRVGSSTAMEPVLGPAKPDPGDCYCHLPLYIFCGRHLLSVKLRRSNIDASAGAVEEIARIVRGSAAAGPRRVCCCAGILASPVRR